FFGDQSYQRCLGSRDNDYFVTGSLVELNELASLVVNRRGDYGVHRLASDIFYFFHGPAGHHGGELIAGGIHLLGSLPGHHVASLGQSHLERIGGSNKPVVHELFAKGKSRRGSNDCLIQVEEGTNAGALRW